MKVQIRPRGPSSVKLKFVPGLPALQIDGSMINVLAWGVKGDGSSDDTAAIAAATVAAAESGRALFFPEGTYVSSGQSITTDNIRWVGVPGKTIIRRKAGAVSASLLSVAASGFDCFGITFDGNRANVTGDQWLVRCNSACLSARFERCRFTNSVGASVGNGLNFNGTDTGTTGNSYEAIDCDFDDNQLDGIWTQSADNIRISGCRAWANGRHGINVDISTVENIRQARRVLVTENRIWNNSSHGIVVGNVNSSDTTPIAWNPLGDPEALHIIVSKNVIYDNYAYEIYVAGFYIGIFDNILTNVERTSFAPGSAHLCANTAHTLIKGNIITGLTSSSGKNWAIDAGGASYTILANNYIRACPIGINMQGYMSQAHSNLILECNIGITVQDTEGAGGGLGQFDGATDDIDISDNLFKLPNSNSLGVRVYDGAKNIRILNNRFRSTDPAVEAGRAIDYATDLIEIRGNSWNGSATGAIVEYSPTQMEFAYVYDNVTLNATAVTNFHSYLTWRNVGKVRWLRVTNGGSGYKTATTTVTINGVGTGATAQATVDSNGVVTGFHLLTQGTGYDQATTVTISGEGTGATATAQVGHRLPHMRRMMLMPTNAAGVSISHVGTNGNTNPGTTLPAGKSMHFPVFSVLDFCVTFNQLRLLNNPSDSYVEYSGSGHIKISGDGGKVMIKDLPTTATGLDSGTLWNNGGTLAISP